MTDFIEKVVYINLEHRIDRKQHITKELLKVFPEDKIVRFNAIAHRDGYPGCTMSHIECLKLAKDNNWKNVLIVEDDMVFKHANFELVETLSKNEYDVIMLGGAFVKYDPETYRVTNATLAHCYLVNNHYYDKLISNLEEGLKLLLQGRSDSYNYANDRYWSKLQKSDNWFIIQPSMATQLTNYSDNTRVVDDIDKFIDTPSQKTNPLKEILKITTKNVS